MKGIEELDIQSLDGTDEHRWQFNGVEKNESFGLNWNETFYRTYDMQLGRWNAVDSKPTYSQTTYMGMGNNSMRYNDVLGDTTYLFNESGEYSGWKDLDVDGVKGSIGAYNTVTDKDGKESQVWESTLDFTFNDPNVDRRQLDLLYYKEGKKKLQIITDENINDLMERSGIKKMSFWDRWSYAKKESSGGNMDFAVKYFDTKPQQKTNDIEGGFVIFGSQNIAYNLQDGGNWLWGQAMERLGFNYGTAEFGAEANEWFQDSDADQRAIKSGFFYNTSNTNTETFELSNER